MRIAIGGDVFLGGDLANSSKKAIYIDKFDKADLRLVNLEQAVSDQPNPLDKCTLYSKEAALIGLGANSIECVSLANNHIHDLGLDGIVETKLLLENLGVQVTGAGANISKASQAITVENELCILGYCEHSQPYLRDIAIATSKSPGVNPLRFEKIFEDLNELADGTKAILMFHWGVEHVRFPPRKDIELAKKLLELESVALIIGMHSHVLQGYVEHNGKRAYMSLGNFLFPEFHFNEPTQIVYPDKDASQILSTFGYHRVTRLTKKKWRYQNRVSMQVYYDSDTGSVSHSLSKQEAGEIPVVKSINGFENLFWLSVITALSKLYQTNKYIYSILESSSYICKNLRDTVTNTIFHLRQNGIIFVLKKVKNRLHN